jgi:hypothetical protein
MSGNDDGNFHLFKIHQKVHAFDLQRRQHKTVAEMARDRKVYQLKQAVKASRLDDESSD